MKNKKQIRTNKQNKRYIKQYIKNRKYLGSIPSVIYI